MRLSLSQHATLHRIDRERTGLHRAIRQRIEGADRRREDIGDSIERLATIAYLRGLKRSVDDYHIATGKDARTEHLMLSRSDEERKRDREIIAWLIAFLGLSATQVVAIQQRAKVVAGNAGRELERVRATKIQAKAENDASPHSDRRATRQAASDSTSTATIGRRTADEDGGGGPDVRRSERAGLGVLGEDRSVFGTFGRANLKLPAATLDTWAETVAYSQYESGRWDAIKIYPAIAEALWGYRWSSVLDTRTTTGCRLLDGWVAPIDDNAMQELRPPRHFNCRSVLVPVYQNSRLKTPVEVNRPTDATIARYFAQKQEFLARLN